MYALIRNNEIVQVVDMLPRIWTDPDTGEWHDWRRPPYRTQPADLGWLQIVWVPKPDDTATTIWEQGPPELIDGVPTTVWVERDKTQDELDAEQRRIDAEIRRQTEEAVMTATIALMQDAHTDGQPWVQPTGAHDAYALGVSVTHNDKTWDNITPANVWEPGVSGWRERVGEGYPVWIQPTGAHDAYNIGDRVSFEGANYESKVNGNTWSPTEYPAGWQLIP